MPQYSNVSKSRLETVHQDVQTICHYAIQIIDFSVVFGHRTDKEQFAIYQKGRKFVYEKWVVIGKVFTYKDGYKLKSRHQSGEAIDLTPYPGGYNATPAQWHRLAGTLKATAYLLKKYGDIEHDINWGYDLWRWESAHWELKK